VQETHINGSLATAGIIVNAIPRLMNAAAAGLVTMKDLAVLSAIVEDVKKYVYSFAKT